METPGRLPRTAGRESKGASGGKCKERGAVGGLYTADEGVVQGYMGGL